LHRKGESKMQRRKPFQIIEERKKGDFIVIGLHKKQKIYSYSLFASIDERGAARARNGKFKSIAETVNDALLYVITCYNTEKHKKKLAKFRLMENMEKALFL
jgi:sortase (surface protein transpeptidase)